MFFIFFFNLFKKKIVCKLLFDFFLFLWSCCSQEGVNDGIYERIAVRPIVDGQPVDCVAYQITNVTRDNAIASHGNQLRPSTVYKNVIIRGAKEHELPAEYIKYLEEIPDNGYNGAVEVHIRLNEAIVA